MKNYYDILEINKNASPEIVEKAYKTLVKKYHPDLQGAESKTISENKMKELNEAYEVISNPEKRNLYNNKLAQFEAEKMHNMQNNLQKSVLNDSPITNSYQSEQNNNKNKANYNQHNHLDYRQKLYEHKIKKDIEKAFYNAYVQNLRNRGYKIKYKRSIKDYFKMFLRGIVTLIISCLVLFLVYHLPFVKNFFAQLYLKNEIFHSFINILLNIFSNFKKIF